mmetsp:Transcript_33885/g.78251  ORF Transcript_33885/g.78251 Transcript_33885/m.78251 type:complete len:217 (-) Transcript_33885:285-935(-)
MALDCAPACRTCHLLDFRRRCPVDPDARPAFSAPGGLDAMFRRIVDGRFDRYAPVVHSGPSRAKKAGPWIVSFDDFLSAEECHRLVDLGVAAGFERSRNVAAEADFDGSHASSLSKKTHQPQHLVRRSVRGRPPGSLRSGPDRGGHLRPGRPLRAPPDPPVRGGGVLRTPPRLHRASGGPALRPPRAHVPPLPIGRGGGGGDGVSRPWGGDTTAEG